MLNLPFPVLNQLADCTNILIAGAGGGFDVFAGLPLYHELTRLGKSVHLFNYSFTNLEVANSAVKIHEPNNYLYGFKGAVQVCPDRKGEKYFPEGYLAEWFGNEITVWATPKAGVVPVQKALQRLVDTLKLDAVILVDGGVDSLMRGDEKGCGTILEDTVSLAALTGVRVPRLKLLATIGFGTELDDGVDHYRVLENMAELIRLDALQGSCCLTKNQDAFIFMKNIYDYVAGRPGHAKSHITPRIIRAVQGEFDNAHPIFVQPLMNLYWFWYSEAVVKQNKIIDKTFCQTNTFTDVTMLFRQKEFIGQRFIGDMPF